MEYVGAYSRKMVVSGNLSIFKPCSGEHVQPGMHDVINKDQTMAAREVAAYRVAKKLGLKFVPETKLVRDPILGLGSSQIWIPEARPVAKIYNDYNDPDFCVYMLPRICVEITAQFDYMILVDLLCRNLDRNDGNILIKNGSMIWIDHGWTFPNFSDTSDFIQMECEKCHYKEVLEDFLARLCSVDDKFVFEELSSIDGLGNEAIVSFSKQVWMMKKVIRAILL